MLFESHDLLLRIRCARDIPAKTISAVYGDHNFLRVNECFDELWDYVSQVNNEETPQVRENLVRRVPHLCALQQIFCFGAREAVGFVESPTSEKYCNRETTRAERYFPLDRDNSK